MTPKHSIHTRTLAVLAGLAIGLSFSDVARGQISQFQAEVFRARDKVLPALVHIQPVVIDYRTGKLQKQSVVGSGVIVRADGYVVTNYHVAGKAREILCTMFDKEQVSATLVGGDPLTDLAVIKLDLSKYKNPFTVATFGASDSLEVGQFVLAMGSPLALSRSVSCGVISTIDRYFPDDMRLPSGERTGQFNTWIQTDAAINPGNSGGPLVDLRGRIVGINSRATLFANSIGFSIPSAIVREVVDQIISRGRVTRSWIGLHFQALQDLEGWFGGSAKGALVASIDPGSPAEKVKLRAGDIVETIGDISVSARFVEEIPSIYKRIAAIPPGSQVRLGVIRRDEKFSVTVTTVELGELLGEDLECPLWGFTVKAITQQMILDHQLKTASGVFVSGVKRPGPASVSGLLGGDVIIRVEDLETSTLAKFNNAYSSLVANGKNQTLLTIQRGSAVRYVLIKTGSDTSPTEGAGEVPSGNE